MPPSYPAPPGFVVTSFVVPLTPDALRAHAVATWPQQDITVLHAEAEAAEAEGIFADGLTLGTWRATHGACAGTSALDVVTPA